MDIELALLRAIGRCLPPLPHATAVINRVLKPVYLRKPRVAVVTTAWGIRMRLNPAEAVDGGILFYPQLYNRTEFRWLRSLIRPGDRFADVGAYLGAYSLMAAQLGARVTAIEANPEAYAVLTQNIRMNSFAIEAIHCGASDRAEELSLTVQRSQNMGGSSFLVASDAAIRVPCRPLVELVPRADVMKIDIEGMEFKVLRPYLANSHRPRAIILEAPQETEALQLCLSLGYAIQGRTQENVLLTDLSKTGQDA